MTKDLPYMGAPGINSTAGDDTNIGGSNDEHLGFKKLEHKLEGRKGVYDPAGLAAAIGRKKYGAKGMAAKAHGHDAVSYVHGEHHKVLTHHGWQPLSGHAGRVQTYTHPQARGHFIHSHSTGKWFHVHAGAFGTYARGTGMGHESLSNHLTHDCGDLAISPP